MNRFHLYHGLLAITGVVLALSVVLSASENSVFALLLVVGGSLVALPSLYTLLTKDSTDFTIGRYQLRTAALGTLLALAGTILQLLS